VAQVYHFAALLPMRDARTVDALVVLMAANNVPAAAVARGFGGAIHRRKKPLGLNADPLHRKAERAVQAFS
jgi:hypothetical protein